MADKTIVNGKTKKRVGNSDSKQVKTVMSTPGITTLNSGKNKGVTQKDVALLRDWSEENKL